MKNAIKLLRAIRLPLVTVTLCAVVAGSGVAGSGVAGSGAPAMAAQEESAVCEADLGPAVTAGEATAGSLLLATDHSGLYVTAPTVRSQVDLRVSGMVVRGRVRQTFRNPTAFWVEGEYVFPLPENSAVDRLSMVTGDQVIEGEIQEREQARETYVRARDEGRRASLVEQRRPNVFRAAVANLGPGEEIQIEIGYLQTLRWVDGGYRLRFPTVVAPRYGEGGPLAEQSAHPRVVLPCDEVVDGRMAPKEPPSGSLDLTVELAVGGPLESLDSSHHEVVIDLEDGFLYRVSLRENEFTDRDFELTWKPLTGSDATARAFVEQRDGAFYTLLMIFPPAEAAAGALVLPRETVFVIDTSGSMHGESLEQARRALLAALHRLRPEDSFNVIRFASEAEKLFPRSVPLGRYSLAEAIAWVEELESNGGTDVRAALAAALDGEGAGYPIRQIVFITDGAVSDERGLAAYLEANLGGSRLFTVGIGSAPNSFFMRKAAEAGRGTFTHIGSIDQVEQRMEKLFRKLETPVLTDLFADWGDPLIEAFPSTVPDLYAGEPLVVLGRGFTPLEGVTLSGSRGAVPWSQSLTLPESGREVGIGKLWARGKLGELSDALVGSLDPDPLRREALEVALSFHLVSAFTSLVAVDRSPVRPLAETPVPRAIPLIAPAGWAPRGRISGLPVTATASRLWALVALASLLAGAFLISRRGHARA